MPSVEPGVIIEYRWKEIRPNQLANNVRLQFQREIPVQFVKYYLKPAQMDLKPFPHVERWLGRVESRDSWAKSAPKM